MSTFISVPLKKAVEVDLHRPLANFIASTFSSADNPENYSAQLAELQKLRTNVCCRSLDKHETSLDQLYRYHDQIMAMESKFPLEENQVRIPFKWKDAFDKGSLFSGKASLTVCTAAFERACLLFNVAAMQSQVAEVQNHNEDEGLKSSARLFQLAGGIFAYLKDNAVHMTGQDPTLDMSYDSMTALSSLMLAQAQEAFYLKATLDKMKDAVVAKVANQCSDLYAEALKLMQASTIRDQWEKDWINMVAGKQALYHGLAEYHQACVAKAKKEVGEEISRLQHASQLLQAAASRAQGTLELDKATSRVRIAHDAAKKDNDFIYHEVVPDVATLPAIGKANLAKPLPVAGQMSSKFTDLFQNLVPIAVHQALAVYDTRKSEIVNTEIGKLRESTQLMNSILASLNLPAGIEDLAPGSANALPASIKEKSEAIKSHGGLQALQKQISDLPELLKRNKEILDETMRQLDEEEMSDNQLREQFKERWERTPSAKLTAPLRAEGLKYQTIISNAITADGVVKEKFSSHKTMIELLCKSEHELVQGIPAASSGAALQNSPIVKELRGYIEQVETIKAERDAVETEIKDTTFDMSGRFLQALANDGAINEEGISLQELSRLYGPLQKQVTESIKKQEVLMANIQKANTEFVKQKSSNQSAAKREEILRDLAAAHDAFMELTANLKEGTKFYNDLTQILLKFQMKVGDFCFARKTEKEDLMKDLQQSIANQPTAAPPKPPRHHQEAAKAAPVRPPPPSTTAAAQTPASTSVTGAPASAPSQQYVSPPAYGATPVPQFPQGYGYTMPAMPTGYNPYAVPYPTQQYPQQGYPQPAFQYPQQPGYPYPQQQYPGQQPPPYPQQQWQQ